MSQRATAGAVRQSESENPGEGVAIIEQSGAADVAERDPNFCADGRRRWRKEENRQVQQAILLAFEGIGGVHELTEWARNNRETFYTRIWAPMARSSSAAAVGITTPEGYQFGLMLSDGEPSAEQDVARDGVRQAGQALEGRR